MKVVLTIQNDGTLSVDGMRVADEDGDGLLLETPSPAPYTLEVRAMRPGGPDDVLYVLDVKEGRR